jgi:chemotaxis response regulator CheB
MIRVLLVEDNGHYRQMVARWLAGERGMEVVGIVETPYGAAELIRKIWMVLYPPPGG